MFIKSENKTAIMSNEIHSFYYNNISSPYSFIINLAYNYASQLIIKVLTPGIDY